MTYWFRGPRIGDRRVSDHYTTGSYRKAIQDACAKAKVPRWAPNQLRHACATLVRRKFGLEESQAILGHRKIETTQINAQRNLELALKVMGKLG
jgi:integrase